MTRNVIVMAILFVAVLLLQVICLRICLFNVAMPIVFIYALMRLPIKMNVNVEFTIAFLTGLVVDVFGNTPGMNALSCLMLVAIRRPVFGLYFSRADELPDTRPSATTVGFVIYVKYMLTLTFAYCIMIFGIQSFAFGQIGLTILRILASSLLSALLMMGLESVVATKPGR